MRHAATAKIVAVPADCIEHAGTRAALLACGPFVPCK
jgi:hypothetical protein